MHLSRWYSWLIIGYFFAHIYIDITYCKSISQNGEYPEFCLKAAQDEIVFQTFRSNEIYRRTVETLGSFEYGTFFLNEINARYPHLLKFMKQICLEDAIGGPLSFYFQQIGAISPTVLRYIKIVGDLQGHFGDLSNFNIAEIGGGFGGQCKMIHDVCGFATYTIIDIPQCAPLITKYLSCFGIKNTKTIDNDRLTEPTHYDLIISNYAISEIDRTEQLHYFEMILDQAERGYIIYNHFPQVNPFSIDEFFTLLQKHHKNVTIVYEDPRIIGDIIIWHP